MEALVTPRLILEPVTLAVVEATFAGDRPTIEALVKARMPEDWPGLALVERAFCASLEHIRQNPEKRLWGDRLMIAHLGGDDAGRSGERWVVGSVVFHGRPDDGVAEVGYGVEERFQRRGFASEATRACVDWALAQPGIRCVTATTPPWHTASIRVLENAGLTRTGSEMHETLGEVLRFTRNRSA